MTIPVLAPETSYEARLSQFDLRLAKVFNLTGKRIKANVDIYNLFNANTIMSEFQTYGPRLNQPQEVLVGRLMRIGAQFHF